ncbi:MAG: PucC family protein [Pseudomonadota bacterium]
MLDRYRTYALEKLAALGPRLLPFADAASADLPLPRLIRLSLFQFSVGMALVLLVGTLNRVMIVELGVPASVVAAMISLPLLFAPFRALIGFRSDVHVSALGWRRVPFIYRGTMLQFGGFAVMPFALLVLSGYMDAAQLSPLVGIACAALAFILVGAGAHMVQTVGLALATDLAAPEKQPQVVGLMYVSMLVGMALSALAFGAALADYSPGRLIQVIQAAAVLTVVLNAAALWKQEPRDRRRAHAPAPTDGFAAAWRTFVAGDGAARRLLVIGVGTMGFGMADVLIEPFGGQILGLSVGATTKLTATFAGGGLLGFALASHVLSQPAARPMRLAVWGALAGAPALSAVIAAGPLASTAIFVAGVALLGFGAGLFVHGTLTATMRAAPREQTGLALGAWGAVQASAAGLAALVGGVVRDGIVATQSGSAGGLEAAYRGVFALEIALLIAAALLAVKSAGAPRRARPSSVVPAE